MTQPTAIHYQPPHNPIRKFACGINWVHGITDQWTDDPTKVRCGNCERTEVWRKAMHGLNLIVAAHLALGLDPLRHITGRPVRRPMAYFTCERTKVILEPGLFLAGHSVR